MKSFLLFKFLLFSTVLYSQDISQKLGQAINKLADDAQFRNSLISMCVVETKTGKLLYSRNSDVGVAPASCQKIVTSASAFELLGPDYQFKTLIQINPAADSSTLLITPSGDPTMGSWRWSKTKTDAVYSIIHSSLKKRNIRSLVSGIEFNAPDFSYQPVPDGWVWQDIGNYFGAGAWALNWHENQYTLSLSSTNTVGSRTQILSFDPLSATMPIKNFILAGQPGSGDNAYIYAAPYNESAYATGTIPPGKEQFTISGSMPDPSAVFIRGLKTYLNKNNITISSGSVPANVTGKTEVSSYETLDSIMSPELDSMNYWFMKKSINLYGEAFVKAIGLEKANYGSTDTGVMIIRDFWSKRGIERSALKIIDGSGLSPANRVTTRALVNVLQYAKKQLWYNSFYSALPEMNGIKMKDGYIGGVRAYTGYVKSANGSQYSFSFIVNNFDGSPSTAREKMWKVLDILK